MPIPPGMYFKQLGAVAGNVISKIKFLSDREWRPVILNERMQCLLNFHWYASPVPGTSEFAIANRRLTMGLLRLVIRAGQGYRARTEQKSCVILGDGP